MPPQKPVVCVTGASGFIGSRITADLLERGYTVRGTVRDPSHRERYGFLQELPGADERLSLHPGRLLADGSFDEALEGAHACIHTASPYVLDTEDPQQDLVEPAVRGTRNVLRSAAKAQVTRLVVTSSMAAITDEPGSDRVLTESDWNTSSSLQRNPYYFSKTEAERAAWAFYDEQEVFSMAVINPFLVIGPSLTPSLNTSNNVLVDLLTGGFPAIIRLTWGMVDVRDVSAAHLRALEHSEASGRFICVEHTVSMASVVKHLREAGYAERYQLPRFNLAHPLGDYLVKLGSYFEAAGTGSYLRTHVGAVPAFDNSRSTEVLGLRYRPLHDTLRDTVEDLKRWGHLKG